MPHVARLAALCLAIVVRMPAASAAEPDWSGLTDEATRLLSRYVAIDTTNPPGNELPAANFLRSVLAADGVQATLYPSAENRANLLARIPGRGQAAPLLLLHHMDVVPAEPAGWTAPPFGGTIRDGFVYGRGSLDDKGHGIVQLVAALARVRAGSQCSRDILLLAVADEEVDGESGARFMIRTQPEAIRAAAVWNEGGASVEGVLPNTLVNSIGVTEKNALWLTLRTEGPGGHGSAPTPDGAVEILTAALARVLAWDTPLHLTPTTRDAFSRLGERMFRGGGFLLRHIDMPIVGWMARGRFTSNRVTNGLVRDTIAFTGMRAGVKHNVIPTHAEADLDVRLLPDRDPKEFLVTLSRVIADPRVRILPARELPVPRPPSDSGSGFFVALERALQRRLPGSVTIPGLLTGSSDCTAFRDAGIPCYGYQPLRADADMIGRYHGADERLSIDNLRLGIQVTYDVLDAMCAAN